MQKWTRVMYQPNLPLGENGEKVTACKRHIALSKEAAKEGIVLLKNDGQVKLARLTVDFALSILGDQ